jgi:hypothetical protein
MSSPSKLAISHAHAHARAHTQVGTNIFVRIAAINANNDTAGAGAYAYAGPQRVIALPGAPRPALLRVDSRARLYVSWLPPQYTGALNPAAPILTYKVAPPPPLPPHPAPPGPARPGPARPA